MNIITMAGARTASRSDGPRKPYPLYWSPRIYGAAFGLTGAGGAS